MSVENHARPGKVARRTLIAGAAWAVPTVAVLSATPAFAASTRPLTAAIVNPHTSKNGASPIYFDLKVTSELSSSTGFTYTVSIKKDSAAYAVYESGSGSSALSSTWTKSDSYPSSGKATPGTYEILFTVVSGGQTYSAYGSVVV